MTRQAAATVIRGPAILLYLVMAVVRVASDLPLVWMFYFLLFPGEGSGGFSAALVNALLFFAFGASHSLLARIHAKKWIARITGESAVRALYVVVSGLALAFLLYLWRPLGGELWSSRGASYWILTSLYGFCVLGLVYTTTYIDYAEFVGLRAIKCWIRGQPPRPPAFSVSGPYAYCRHPMYLWLLMALWIGPTMTLGRFEFAVLGSVYLFVGTIFEERNLRQELGTVYDLYRDNVPMWIPRLTPWKLV
ncbi:MAG: hypothetical protein HYX75_02915 [Acidobacteria bacterium]|nr:hypothetical protein [Acidobacteriota bacterium]